MKQYLFIYFLSFSCFGFGFGPPTPFTPHCSIIPCDGAGVCAGQAFIEMGSTVGRKVADLNGTYEDFSDSLSEVKKGFSDSFSKVDDQTLDQADKLTTQCELFSQQGTANLQSLISNRVNLANLKNTAVTNIILESNYLEAVDVNNQQFGHSSRAFSNLSMSNRSIAYKAAQIDSEAYIAGSRERLELWINDAQNLSTSNRQAYLKKQALMKLTSFPGFRGYQTTLTHPVIDSVEAIEALRSLFVPVPLARSSLEPSITPDAFILNNFVEKDSKERGLANNRVIRQAQMVMMEAYLRHAIRQYLVHNGQWVEYDSENELSGDFTLNQMRALMATEHITNSQWYLTNSTTVNSTGLKREQNILMAISNDLKAQLIAASRLNMRIDFVKAESQ
jgi:hypothetical protein